MTAVVSRRMRRAVVTVHGLPRLEGRSVYQLWLVSERPTSFRSLGVLGADAAADGTPGPVVTGGLDEWSYAFTVTVEPTGGSPVPSSDTVVQLPCSHWGSARDVNPLDGKVNPGTRMHR